MSEKIIAGADLSVSKEDANDSWLAIGKLNGLGVEIVDLRRIAAHALAREVAGTKSISALGIDCPFSLPEPFLQYIATKLVRKDYQSWQEVAEQLAFMPFDEFAELSKQFKKEPTRFTDTASGAKQHSPMHRGNPPLLQTTYQMIRTLSAFDPTHFFVLPFQKSIDFGCPVIEVCASSTFNYFGIANGAYQGQDKKGETKLMDARGRLLQALATVRERKGVTYQDCPRLTVPKKFEHSITVSDHALDAVTAAYTTAIFTNAPQLFADPFSSDRLEVLLEGWTYVPASAGK